MPPTTDLPRPARTNQRGALRQNNTTGKSAKSCPSPFENIFCFAANPNHRRNAPISSQQEGRLAIATNAGRDAVDAEVPITNGTIAYGEVVWS